MKYINKIGVELEGGWNNPPQARIYGDASVSVSAQYHGEVSSSPSTLWQVLKWVKKNYPDDTNSTCGLHVHISLKNNLFYSKLMSREFYEFFLTRITEWAEKNSIKPDSVFYHRLKGYNKYCVKTFKADEQVLQREKASVRYSHLNYCFRLHGTLECRLFPMFGNVELACSAITEFCKIVEEWLSKQPRERAIKIEIQEEDTPEIISIKEEVV